MGLNRSGGFRLVQGGEQSQEVINPIQTPDRKAHRLFVWGVAVSVAYTGALAIYSFVEWPHMKAMTPDQFATFLSGAFAPLAFLWLVLGFRQQGDELQNSARALWLQGEELRNSVEQQRQLVQVSREQLEAERLQQQDARDEAVKAAQPQLVLADNGSSSIGTEARFDYLLTTARATCSNVVVLVDGVECNRKAFLAQGGELAFRITFDRDQVREQYIQVRYTDILGAHRLQDFKIPLLPPLFENGKPRLGKPLKIGEPQLATDA